MYCTYVQCTCTLGVCGQYARDLKTCVDLDTFIIIPRFRVVLLFVVNIDILNTSRRAPKPSQDKEDRLLRWRERAQRVAETAEHRQERLTKRSPERDRAGRSTLTTAA